MAYIDDNFDQKSSYQILLPIIGSFVLTKDINVHRAASSLFMRDLRMTPLHLACLFVFSLKR